MGYGGCQPFRPKCGAAGATGFRGLVASPRYPDAGVGTGMGVDEQ